MKTILQMTVREKDGSFREWMRTTVDLPFAPSVGMVVDTAAWGQQTVQRVILGLDASDRTPYLMVYLGELVAETQTKAEELVKMSLLHGWRKPSSDD